MDFWTSLGKAATKKEILSQSSQRKKNSIILDHTRTAIKLAVYQTCVQLLNFGYFARGTRTVTRFFRIHAVRTIATAVLWNRIKSALIYSYFFFREQRFVVSYAWDGNYSQAMCGENIQIQECRTRNLGKEKFWAKTHEKKLPPWVENEWKWVKTMTIELLDKEGGDGSRGGGKK